MASYAYVTLQGPRGLRALLQKEASIAEMENINTKLSRDNEQKRDYIHRLGGDSKVQEQVIRQELKLVHPDEKVFITGPPPAK
ncbi:MAG TPA: septum formation initiator family protein [Bryobacteraceae bacterium]|nr:septum formation initiator family protein [Bryobacteraceae bacterium]